MKKYADLDVEELKRYLQLQEHMTRHDVHELVDKCFDEVSNS